MTGQDWVIIGAGWVALALPLGGVMWDQYMTTARLRRAEGDLQNRHRRLMLLEQQAATPALNAGQQMPPVTGEHRALGGWVQGPAWDREDGPELIIPTAAMPAAAANAWAHLLDTTDSTTQLHRPTARTVESVLARSDRALSRTELGAELGRPADDVLTDLRALVVAGTVRFATDTLGRTVYTLADPQPVPVAGRG